MVTCDEVTAQGHLEGRRVNQLFAKVGAHSAANSKACYGFQHSLGTSSFDQGFDIAASTNNEIYAVGVTRKNGSDDILLTRTDAVGNPIWSKTVGGTGAESVRKIFATSDGGLLVIGQTKSYTNAAGDILCFKADAAGNLLWSRKFGVGSPFGDLGMDIIETTDGGYAISGILNVNGGVADAVVIKLDNNANPVWSKRFDRGDGEDGVGILQKSDTLIVAMDLQNGTGNYTMALTKLKLNDGSLISASKLSPAARGIFNSYLYHNPAQPGYIISGHTIDGFDYSNMKHVIVTVTENFDIIHTRLIDINPLTNDFYTGLVPLPDGSIITCASPKANVDGYIFKISPGGVLQFSKRFNDINDKRLYRLAPSADGILGIGGIVNNGQEDFFITGFNNDGTSAADCTLESVTASIQQPLYSKTTFSWPSFTDVNISSPAITLANAQATVVQKNLCQKAPLNFSYDQNLCNSRSVNFYTTLTGVSNFKWTFGDGQENVTSQSPTNIYSRDGVYSVKLIATNSAGCADSIIRNITVATNYDSLLITVGDTVICLGDSVLLTATNSSVFCWQTTAGTQPTTLNSWVKPTVKTTYKLTSQVLGNNLVANSAFNGGNVAFTSQYSFAPTGFLEGTIDAGISSSAWNSSFSNCKDHTNGSGRMLMVNGSSQPNVNVWSQTITVQPNTDYLFSTWLQSLSPTNFAQLQFSINGSRLGNIFSANSQNCIWKQASSIWNSGTNSSVQLSIVNMNVQPSGNDFSLDDIYFGTYKTVTDSITINVSGFCDSLKITGPGKVCSLADTIQYSILRKPGCTQVPAFFVDTSFASFFIKDSATINVVYKKNGSTIIKAMYANQCKMVADSITVTIKTSPKFIDLGTDLVNCKDTALLLNAGSGFEFYQWHNNSADSTFLVNRPGTYIVTATNFCGAVFTDSFLLAVNGALPFSVSPLNGGACVNDSIQFTATGGSLYSWQPASQFASASAASTKAIVTSSQLYSVRIIDTVCVRDSVYTIPVTAFSKPDVSVVKSNDVSCIADTAVLTASGANTYTWQPANFIVRRGVDQVIVRPGQGMTFYVEGKDLNNCTNKDSIAVNFLNEGDQKLFMPSAFTPNKDGRNDLYKPLFFGQTKLLDFKIFNRWGELIFQTKQQGVGWNGVFKNQLQSNDVFVYYITAEGSCNGKFVQKGTFVLIK